MTMTAYQLQCPRQVNGVRCGGQIGHVQGTDEHRCHLCEREFVMVNGWPVERVPQVAAAKTYPRSKKGEL